MVQLMLTILARPGRASELGAALRSLLLPTQLDRGCRHGALFAMVDQPETFFYLEEWEDRKDLERHIRTRRFTRLLSLMETALDRPVLEFRFVSGIRGLDYVKEVQSRPDVSAGGPEME